MIKFTDQIPDWVPDTRWISNLDTKSLIPQFNLGAESIMPDMLGKINESFYYTMSKIIFICVLLLIKHYFTNTNLV